MIHTFPWTWSCQPPAIAKPGPPPWSGLGLGLADRETVAQRHPGQFDRSSEALQALGGKRDAAPATHRTDCWLGGNRQARP
eukprot:13787818-Alexandrium_andersonii.AAC.1